MDSSLGVVIPDENLFSSVQKITFTNGAYGFYVETGLGCALVFPDGKTVFDVWFKDGHFREVCAVEDMAYIGFRDGRIYDIDSEWEDLRDVCDEWRYLEGFFTFDPSEPVVVEWSEFSDALQAFEKTIFYEPRANYAVFVPIRDFLGFAKIKNS